MMSQIGNNRTYKTLTDVNELSHVFWRMTLECSLYFLPPARRQRQPERLTSVDLMNRLCQSR